MEHSIAQPRGGLAPLGLPTWKSALSWFSAILIGLLFLLSGLWKITDVPAAAQRMVQARVPESLSQAAALLVGMAETVGGVLILIPRLRRWGSVIAALLLVAFVLYMGMNYSALQGEDCSCFPWLKRVVGPGFFIGDAIMLLLAVCAGIWAQRPHGLRDAFLIVGAVAVFAFVSFGVAVVHQTGTKAPDTILVDGRPYPLGSGKFFLFFFNPSCTHCSDTAKRMSHFDWGQTKVVAIPVEMPQFAGQFLQETGLQAVVSSDFAKLKDIFGYKAYPFGVALENGRERAALTLFQGEDLATTLRKLGMVR
jgi:uncharacterized membrane protein YphA (DoxX/SURF4 family)